VTAPRVYLEDVVREADPGFASGKRSPDGILQVRMNCVDSDGGLDLSVAPRVPAIPQLHRYLLQEGDILFNATNSPDLVGKSALFSTATAPVTFSNHFLRLRPHPDRLDAAYLARWLNYQWKRGVFSAMCTQWVNQASIRRDRLLRLKIPLPPLVEQRRIAAVLDKANGVRRKRRESLQLLDAFLRSAFLEMFGDPVRNEKGWEVRPLEDLVDPRRPITYGILKPGPDTVGGVPYVRVVDIVDGRINWRGVRRTTRAIAEAYRRSTLEARDLLLSIRGQIGRLALVPYELRGGNITQDTARLALLPDLTPEFALSCLSSAPMQHLLQRFVKGVAVTGINLGDVKQLPIPVPPHPLQVRFSELLHRWQVLRARVTGQGDQATALFDSLAQLAFGPGL
jgi:type I restriction enzyme S subunit